jgi:hypothetical protein
MPVSVLVTAPHVCGGGVREIGTNDGKSCAGARLWTLLLDPWSTSNRTRTFDGAIHEKNLNMVNVELKGNVTRERR